MACSLALVRERLHDHSVHKYTAFYCEENIWHLAKARMNGSALFISNRERAVACFMQKRAGNAFVPMIWDYHVVWLEGTGTSATIWDFDSTLPLGTEARAYFEATFRPVQSVHAPTFRRIPRDEFVATFRSDRRHMRRADGSLAAPEPPWPCIGEGSNLDDFISMNGDGPGKVFRMWEVLAEELA
jgi:protein N-terminal glutamine amidohydrolase